MSDQGANAGGARQARFLEGNLFWHVTVMALTATVGLMAIFLVDLVNLVYISWLGDPEATAAVGYAGAVLFFTTAFGIGMSIGVSALVARAVGGQDLDLARSRATNGLILGAVVGCVFAALVFAFLPDIIGLLGATGATAEKALWFLQLLVPTQPLLMIGMVGSAVLRSHGDARRAMMVTVWGAVALMILDPILILWADLGLTGAAMAGFVSRLVIAGMALWPLHRHYGGFVWPRMAALMADAAPIAAISAPAILTQIATPVGQAFVTRAMAGYGEAAVAGMAIAGRMTPVAFGVIFALSGAVGPIIGQNFGAGRMDRVRRAFLDAMIFTALVILAVSALLFLLRAPIADLFKAKGLTRDLVYLFCGPLTLLYFFNGVIFVGNAACNNLGRPLLSTLVNWGRHTLGTIPFVIWLGAVWGAPGVLIGQGVGGAVFAAMSWGLAVWAIAHPKGGGPRR